MNREAPMPQEFSDAIIQLLHHLDGSQVLAEATLGLILARLAAWASLQAHTAISYNKKQALRTLSLVVTA